MDKILVQVSELWLKGKNRPLYFKALRRHVKESADLLHRRTLKIENVDQRMILSSEHKFSRDFLDGLTNIPGIHSVIPAIQTKDKTLESILETASPGLEAKIKEGKKTFKVKCRRTDRTFPIGSMEVCREIGHLVLVKYPELSVDVKDPDIWLELRILQDGIYVSLDKLPGIGGLPWGTSGHLITMLSGGFDSPVASYMMAKRGCAQTFAFFYSYPYVGEEVLDKIKEIAVVLGKYQKGANLYVIPFGDVQKELAKTCKNEYRTILFRKYMVDCSTILAKKVKADAILTGDALGQVSSQTIGNISIIDMSAKLPIFRPLLGLNKSEIIEISRQIGTHDISVIPHDDACSLFAPKHPIIKPNNTYLGDYFRDYPMTEMLEYAVNNSIVFRVLPDETIKKLI